MTYDEFVKFVEQECIYETVYKDSDSKVILVITLPDAYAMLNNAMRKLKGKERG